jgi:H+/Cl- antiporter ClcA
VKVLGLSVALGSGAILGKEGPFVHLSSVIGKIIKEGSRLIFLLIISESIITIAFI